MGGLTLASPSPLSRPIVGHMQFALPLNPPHRDCLCKRWARRRRCKRASLGPPPPPQVEVWSVTATSSLFLRPTPSSATSFFLLRPTPSPPPSSTDPYWIHDGLQLFELEAEFGRDPDGLGVAGGMEKERCKTGVELMSPMDFAPVYFPWKPSTEEWAECVAIADKQCKEEGFLSLDEVMSF